MGYPERSTESIRIPDETLGYLPVVAAQHHVGAQSVRAIGSFTPEQGGNPQHGALFLDRATVRDHERGSGQHAEKL